MPLRRNQGDAMNAKAAATTPINRNGFFSTSRN
jgi:hypothetical protein